MGLPFDNGINSVVTASGGALAGAKLYWYDAGTTTPRDTFQTAALDPLLKNTNPVVADANGRFGSIYLSNVAYKYVLTTSTGTTLVTRDNYTSPTTQTTITAAVDALEAALADDTGATLIGRAGGGTVQDIIDILVPFFETYVATRKLTIETLAADLLNGLDIYHSSDQTNAANQKLAFAIHNYTDGVSATIDTVGSNASLRLKQANNASARPDKASTYVGTGVFLDIHRARTSGAGNLGTGNDRLAMIDENGCYTSYGPGAADWAGLSTNAPIKLGTYTGFLTKLMYMGYDYANDKAIIGSIDNNTSTFKPLDVAASALRPIGDNSVSLGASSKRWTYVHALTVVTSPVTVATLPAAATAGAGARAFVTDGSVVASGNFGATVAGGGANKVPVYSDGTNWIIG